MTNLLVSLLDKAGVTVDKLGDSTGTDRSGYVDRDMLGEQSPKRESVRVSGRECSRDSQRPSIGVVWRCCRSAQHGRWRAAPPLVEAVKAGNIDTVRALLAQARRSERRRGRRHDGAALGRALRQSRRRRPADSSGRQRAEPRIATARRRSGSRASTAARRWSSGCSSAGADPNTTMPEGDTALMTAARTGNVARREGAAASRRRRQRTRELEGADRAHVGGGRQQRGDRRGARSKPARMFRPARNITAAAAGSRPVDSAAGPSATPTSPNRPGSPRCTSPCAPARTDAVKVLLKSGATVHDTTSDGTGVLVMAIASTHLRARGLAARAGRRSECRRPGMDAASSDRLHAQAQYRRQQSRPRPEGQARQPDARTKTARARRESEPAGDEESRRHERRTQAADRGRRDAVLGGGADARSAVHAAAGRARRRSAASPTAPAIRRCWRHRDSSSRSPARAPALRRKSLRRSSSVWISAPTRRRSTTTAIPRCTASPCGDRTTAVEMLVAAGAQARREEQERIRRPGGSPRAPSSKMPCSPSRRPPRCFAA